MPTVLITGASRGLGLEFVRQYAQAGWRVHACYRDPKKSADLTKLANSGGNSGGKITAHALDVADFAQIEALARTLSAEKIDVLLNNAGVYARGAPFGHLEYAVWERSFRVNSLAPVRMAEAFVDHVAQSQKKMIVNVTSLMGSLTDNTSGGSYAYRASKAALNMATVCMAHDLKARGITTLVLHPGWVKTDMGGPDAPVEAAESVRGMRAVIDKSTLEQSGKFFDYTGDPLPW